MRMLVAFLLLFIVPPAHAQIGAGCTVEGKCVEDFKKQGWQEVAACNAGDQWSHVLQKNDEQLLCLGMNARGGPQDRACLPFTGSLEKYRAMAAAAKQQVDDYNAAKNANQLDSYLQKRMKSNAPSVNCVSGFETEKGGS
ncbi:MAG TPA: hypothetical protein VHB73_00710 [Alphaproteobacteria bacterium]|nr:hypothetical protein [Alphaproteobacteria bacterium]